MSTSERSHPPGRDALILPWGLRLALVCGVLAAMAGCRPKQQILKDRAIVSGIVTFDGKPLPAGTISFQAIDRPVATATPIGEGGAYSTDRAPLGKNLVTVDTASIQFGNPSAYVPIPARYADPKAAGLSADVQPGENEHVDFTLTK